MFLTALKLAAGRLLLLPLLTGSVLCSNLFDVFNNICADEKEHVKTMTACRDYSIVDDLQLVIQLA